MYYLLSSSDKWLGAAFPSSAQMCFKGTTKYSVMGRICRSALKEDLNCTTAELVYGTPFRLPGEFFSSSLLPVSPDENYIARLKLYMNSFKATSPRSSHFGTSFIKKPLMQTSHVFVRRDSVRKPLEQPSDGLLKSFLAQISTLYSI